MKYKKGRSEKKTSLFGREYIQHYNSKGEKSGTSEFKETIFGRNYTQHYKADRSKAGHSEQKETFTGRKYTQKYNVRGDKSGKSENNETFFGSRYKQHYDSHGNETDRSEKKETFFGRKYTERYGKNSEGYSGGGRNSGGSDWTNTASQSESSGFGIFFLVILGLIALAVAYHFLANFTKRDTSVQPTKSYAYNSANNQKIANEMFNKYFQTIEQSYSRKDYRSLIKYFTLLTSELSSYNIDFDIVIDQSPSYSVRRSFTYYRTLYDFLSGNHNTLPKIKGQVIEFHLNMSAGGQSYFKVRHNDGAVSTLNTNYAMVLTNANSDILSRENILNDLLGSVAEFYYDKNTKNVYVSKIIDNTKPSIQVENIAEDGFIYKRLHESEPKDTITNNFGSTPQSTEKSIIKGTFSPRSRDDL